MKEIRIEGEINSWTRYDVLWQLNHAKGQPVTMKVASYGGDIAAAVAISHAIRDHGDVTVIHDSLNASAATWLPFGAKTIKIHEDCMLYVHCSSQEVFMWSLMNAEQLKELGMEIEGDVRSLETMDKMIANKYAKRSGGKYTQEQMLKLMGEHPWLTAKECLDYGFVDEIIAEPTGKKLTNSVASHFKNCAIPMPKGVVVEKPLLQKIAERLGIGNKDNTFIGDMNKKYIKVNALLKVEGIEQSGEGKLLLTEEQLQVIEDALAEKQGKSENLGEMEKQLANANAAKKTAEDSLKAATDSLDALSDDIKNIDDIAGKCAKIKEMFDKVPVVPGAVSQSGGKDDQYADIRIDPVNFYDQE